MAAATAYLGRAVRGESKELSEVKDWDEQVALGGLGSGVRLRVGVAGPTRTAAARCAYPEAPWLA